MPTIHDTAKAAGVSIATVSRVINGTGPVSSEVRERVERAIAELGYRPNALARSLRTESTGTIGLIVSNILNPYFTELARAAEDSAIADGFTVLLGNSDELAAKEELYIKQFLEKRVDGLILNPAAADSKPIRTLVSQGFPLVLIDRDVEGADVPLVRADGKDAIFELLKHVAEHHHTRPAIISGPTSLRNGAERHNYFIQAAAQAGMQVDPAHVVYGDFERKSGFDAMQRLLQTDPAPDFVFVSNGRMALGALEALRDRGIRVGTDLAFASYDDDPFFKLLNPSITAIEQPTAEIGRLAMQVLISEIRERRSAAPVTPLRAELIIRQSCGDHP